MTQIDTRQYTVQGMTCSHCVLSVREAVSDVPSGSRSSVGGSDATADAAVHGYPLGVYCHVRAMLPSGPERTFR
jgi:hypothetical protein